MMTKEVHAWQMSIDILKNEKREKKIMEESQKPNGW